MLPSTYQQVEYIGTSGSQHIDTGYKPNNNTRLVMKFSFVSVPSTNAVFGSRNGTTDKNFNLWATGSSFNPQYNGNDWSSNPVSCSIAARAIYNIDFNKNVFSYSSSSSSGSTTLSTTGTFTGSYSIFLSAVNTGGGKDSRTVSIKIYSCKIYDNGTLVRSFIPCYRKSDSVIGLYDDVNGVFYTNAGSGTFSKGNNIVESSVVTYKTVIYKAIESFNNIQENLPSPVSLGIGTPGSSGSNSTPAAIANAISNCAVINLGNGSYKTGLVDVYNPADDNK